MPGPHQAPWLQPGLMADPHGTGEVSKEALDWGLECEDTNPHQPPFPLNPQGLVQMNS